METAIWLAEVSTLILSPDMVGPSIARNQGILGEGMDLTLKHLQEMRQSTILFYLAKRLLYTKYRDPCEEPKLYLFGQLKRITRQWLEGGHLHCIGGTHPAQLRGEDAKEKANTMQVYWVPGVNNLGKFGRWAFAEFTEVFEIQAEFDKLVTSILFQ